MRTTTITLLSVVLLGGCGEQATHQPSLSDNSSATTHDTVRVTYSRDVAPILYQHCVVCHRPNGSAPFPLMTYEHASKRAEQLAEVTNTRYMPPWLPNPFYVHFAGERWLSEEEIETLEYWVLLGAKEGNPAERPDPPTFSGDWQLGQPDLVIQMPEVYRLAAGGTDVFRNFVAPVTVTETRYVCGLEFRPGNVKVVHHAGVQLDATNSSKLADERDDQPGFDGMQRTNAKMPDGHMLGWIPGKTPFTTADDMAWRMDPGTSLVFELHLQPTGKPEDVQCSVGLYFTDQVPTRFPFLLRLSSQTIDIPAGDPHYVIRDAYTLPIDVKVIGVYPHAHYLGRTMQGQAKLPDGTTQWLMQISDWDFNWQDMFQLSEPLYLPKGTTVEMEFTYDNSTDNPRNPNAIPKRILYGPQTSDAMGDLWLQVLPSNRDDWETLAAHYRHKSLRDMLKGIVHTLHVDPDNAVAHYNLGLAFLQHGKQDKARHHFELALNIDPKFADAYNNLGTIYAMERNNDRAIHLFRKALSLNTNYVDARFNLGIALQFDNKMEEAAAHLQNVLQHKPEHLRARHHLAKTLLARGMYDDAISHLLHCLALNPGSAEIAADLQAAEQLKTKPTNTNGQANGARRLSPEE